MSGFRFKQFYVQHDRCAMKVGTDGILLGAAADIQKAKRILDLGTGSGLIALMLAQRSAPDCRICAVELDSQAAQQAAENVANSIWADKIQIYQQDIAQFCQQTQHKFDLIVANPPYFASGVDCRDTQRASARYISQQSHLDWLNLAAHCLNPQGKIQFILPYEAAKLLIKSTALFCAQCLEIFSKPNKAPQRMIVSFQREPCLTQTQQLLIYNQQNQYSPEFIALTREFYLKM